MIIDFSNYSASQRYHLMTQTIIPRPIAWALTASNLNSLPLNNNNEINLAPFSYFTAVSSEPAILMISVGKKPNGDAKDTLVNVLKNKKMVIHIASEQQAELVTQTAATLPYGQSELTLLETEYATPEIVNKSVDSIVNVSTNASSDLLNKPLTKVQSNPNQTRLNLTQFKGFELPRLQQCHVAYGCDLYEIKEMGDTPQTLIFLEVKQVFINEEVIQLDDKNRIKVNAAEVKPLARLGANEYAGITKPYINKRPQ